MSVEDLASRSPRPGPRTWARPDVRAPLPAVLALLLAASPAASQNPGATAADVEEGERLFARNCALCHGGDATGGRGPDLTRGFFRHARNDDQLFAVVRFGIDGTGMPGAGLSDAQAWQVVSFVRSLDDRASEPISGDAARGRELFFGPGQCSTCHMVDGRGSRQGPDLSWVGWRRGPDYLRQALIDPNADVDPRWWTARLETTDGVGADGYLVGEDQFTVRLLNANDQLLSFSKSELAVLERVKISRMPSYRGSLDDEQIDDLVAYLTGLRGGGSAP